MILLFVIPIEIQDGYRREEGEREGERGRKREREGKEERGMGGRGNKRPKTLAIPENRKR